MATAEISLGHAGRIRKGAGFLSLAMVAWLSLMGATGAAWAQDGAQDGMGAGDGAGDGAGLHDGFSDDSAGDAAGGTGGRGDPPARRAPGGVDALAADDRGCTGGACRGGASLVW